MFNVAFVLLEHYRKDNKDALLLIPPSCEGLVASFGLKKNEDYIVETELRTLDKKINLVLHHYEFSINKARDFIGSESSNIEYISFYADGLSNILLSIPMRDEFLKDCEKPIKDILFFDFIPKFYLTDKHQEAFSVCDTRALKKLLKSRIVTSTFKDFFERESDISKLQKVMFLAMRPWGEDKFHGGLYSLPKGSLDLKNIVMQSLGSMSSTKDEALVFRGDSRAKEYSIAFFDKISDEFENSYLLDDQIRMDLGIDFFIVLLSEAVDKVIVFNFDSTLVLNIVALGFSGEIIVGAEKGALINNGMSINAVTELEKKIERIKNHLMSLDTTGLSIEQLNETCLRIICE